MPAITDFKGPLSAALGAVLLLVIPRAEAENTCALRLSLIDTYSIPSDARVDGAALGGISGIDYDGSRQWYLVSDDRTQLAEPRFFVAELAFDQKRIKAVTLRGSQRLGTTLATREATPERRPAVADAESIRVVPGRHALLVAGEGDEARQIGPWVGRFALDGAWLGDITVPMLTDPPFAPGEGPRANRSLEGLAPDGGNTLWISPEAPLLQDGPVADASSGANVRLTKLQLHTGTVRQFVYQTETAQEPAPGETSDNGISEILVAGKDQLLVLERSGSRQANGSFRFHTRLFCADLRQATDVAVLKSLAGQPFRSATKTLLLDFASLPDEVAANLEGMAWGPSLARGVRSLVFVSDNNLERDTPTQLLVFKVR